MVILLNVGNKYLVSHSVYLMIIPFQFQANSASLVEVLILSCSLSHFSSLASHPLSTGVDG